MVTGAESQMVSISAMLLPQPPLSPFRRSVNPSGADDRAAFTARKGRTKGPRASLPSGRESHGARADGAPARLSPRRTGHVATVLPRLKEEKKKKVQRDRERAKEKHH